MVATPQLPEECRLPNESMKGPKLGSYWLIFGDDFPALCQISDTYIEDKTGILMILLRDVSYALPNREKSVSEFWYLVSKGEICFAEMYYCDEAIEKGISRN